MGTRKTFVTALGFFTVGIVAMVLVLIPPTDAQAITFGEWATSQGWFSGLPIRYPTPTLVDASSASIDSLTGIGNYDWMRVPTKRLYLHYNQITNIESGAFTGLGGLTSLSLDFNQIASIESGDFTGLGSLTQLTLQYNQIAGIESGDFNGLGSLTSLWVTNNQIAGIESGSFIGLDALTSLNLSSNRITSIESGDFAGLTSVTWLNLGSNQIASIESGSFAAMGQLTYLVFSGNQITSIESGDFAGLGNLKELSLNWNRIASIESGSFAGLGNLTFLDLAGSRLTSIDADMLTGLNKLTFLNFAYNPLTHIESGIFSGFGNLEVLCVGVNALTELNLEGADFSHLTALSLERNTWHSDMSRVSLRNARLNQASLIGIVTGGSLSGDRGIGELTGITELDLSGVDFAAITDLSPLYVMDELTDLWLADTLNLNADALDVLLDNLAAMQSPKVESVLYLTQANYNTFNGAGGGKLAIWDAEPRHRVQYVCLCARARRACHARRRGRLALASPPSPVVDDRPRRADSAPKLPDHDPLHDAQPIAWRRHAMLPRPADQGRRALHPGLAHHPGGVVTHFGRGTSQNYGDVGVVATQGDQPDHAALDRCQTADLVRRAADHNQEDRIAPSGPLRHHAQA